MVFVGAESVSVEPHGRGEPGREHVRDEGPGRRSEVRSSAAESCTHEAARTDTELGHREDNRSPVFTGQSLPDMHCRIEPYLESRRRAPARRWPGVSGGLSLGRPARRTPGRTGNDAGSDRLSARRRCTGAVFLALDCPARGHRV